MATNRVLQLLRSSNVYESITKAKNAILTGNNGQPMIGADGEIRIARYNAGTAVKSLLCVYHTSPSLPNGTAAGWTFIEDASSSEDSSQALKQEIDAIETAVGLGDDGTYVQPTGTNYLNSTTSVMNALGALDGEVKEVNDRIDELDKAADVQNGQVVTTVTQENGLVSETKANVKDLQLGGYTKDVNKTGSIASTDTVNTALSKLENAIDAAKVHSNDQSITVTPGTNGGTNIEVNVDGATIVKDSSTGKLSTALKVIKVIPSGTAGTNEVVDTTLSSNVKEAYRLVYEGSNTAIGKQIEVYKDSSLKSVQLGNPEDTIDANGDIVPAQSPSTETAGQSLNFVYHLADETYQLVKVDVSKFLTESEYGDGLQVSGGVVSVKKDTTSGKVRIADAPSSGDDTGLVDVLTVSSNGVKVDNIQSAINYAVQNASTSLAVSAAGDNVYIAAAVDANDNKKINVTGTYGAFNTPTAADNTLSATTNGIAKAEDVATAVNTVVGNLDGSATATAASGDVYTVLTSVTETNGVIAKGGEVTLAAVAKTGAAADVTVAADQTSGLAAGNVQDTLEALKTSIDGGLDSVSSGNGAIAVGTKTNKDQSISLVIAQHQTDSQTGDALDANDMLTVTNGGLNLSNVWDCGTY